MGTPWTGTTGFGLQHGCLRLSGRGAHCRQQHWHKALNRQSRHREIGCRHQHVVCMSAVSAVSQQPAGCCPSPRFGHGATGHILPVFLQGSASIAVKMDQTVKAYESLQVTSVPGLYVPAGLPF